MEVRNRLLNFDAVIYQNDEWFKFSLDSVLLANFVTLNLRCKKIMEFACGNAAISMLLTYRTSASIVGIEIQKCVYNLGLKSILENGMDKQIQLYNYDIREIKKYFEGDSFDLVICNPPYFKDNKREFLCNNEVKRNSRHEILLKLDDVLKNANYVLKSGGIFSMVHTTDRFVEVINTMLKYNIEPKRVQFINSKKDKNSDIFLIEGIKNGKPGLKVLPNFVVYNDDGTYSDRVKSMYNEEV